MPRPVKPQGEIRQSQVVTTFGPGSMVDLPDHAVIIGGLDHWMKADRQIFEDRLAAKVEQFLEIPSIRFFAPPVDTEDPPKGVSGIKAWLFPEWFVALYEDDRKKDVRSRPLVHLTSLVSMRYFGPDKKKYNVIPVRFVKACLSGHISDIDWYGFTHEHNKDCRRQLWFEERGTSGDISDVFVRCECGESAPMSKAATFDGNPLGTCGGQRPWLGRASKESCHEWSRLLIRSASNAYFPQVLRVISIPDRDAQLKKAVNEVWADFLEVAESADDIRRERKKTKVAAALADFPDNQEVFAEVERRKGIRTDTGKGIKQSELEVFLSSEEEVGEDIPEVDYYAKSLPSLAVKKLKNKIERVVRIHRLREVLAQVGFTRFEDAAPDIDGELQLDVRRAALATETSWVPAIENRGEGIFISFKPAAIDAWKSRPEVKERAKKLMEGFRAWESSPRLGKFKFPGLEYYMLHSLSHLLITSVALECGYSASSLKERIYTVPKVGYGILIYTGTPDAEGTLGGLVEVGRKIEPHLLSALEMGRLCSNDPVCSQHAPDDLQEERFLHGAACHGCLLISETCCERRNDFLDRALVLPTVDGLKAEFFREEMS